MSYDKNKENTHVLCSYTIPNVYGCLISSYIHEKETDMKNKCMYVNMCPVFRDILHYIQLYAGSSWDTARAFSWTTENGTVLDQTLIMTISEYAANIFMSTCVHNAHRTQALATTSIII